MESRAQSSPSSLANPPRPSRPQPCRLFHRRRLRPPQRRLRSRSLVGHPPPFRYPPSSQWPSYHANNSRQIELSSRPSRHQDPLLSPETEQNKTEQKNTSLSKNGRLWLAVPL